MRCGTIQVSMHTAVLRHILLRAAAAVCRVWGVGYSSSHYHGIADASHAAALRKPDLENSLRALDHGASTATRSLGTRLF